jgi:hypothetical protein
MRCNATATRSSAPKLQWDAAAERLRKRRGPHPCAARLARDMSRGPPSSARCMQTARLRTSPALGVKCYRKARAPPLNHTAAIAKVIDRPWSGLAHRIASQHARRRAPRPNLDILIDPFAHQSRRALRWHPALPRPRPETRTSAALATPQRQTLSPGRPLHAAGGRQGTKLTHSPTLLPETRQRRAEPIRQP